MEKLFYSPCEYAWLPDTAAIQAAIDSAVSTDVRVAVIPQKSDGSPWEIKHPLLLTSHITVILDGAAIISDCTVFLNANAEKEGSASLGGEQHRIYIIGRSNAVIETRSDAPQILLSNVCSYRIAGLTFKGGSGVKLNFARHGRLQQLKFHGSAYGLQLSEGCNNNIIEDICAATERETISFRGSESNMFGKGTEIAENIICRVHAKTNASPAISIISGPCDTYNLLIRDVTSQTADVDAIHLGAPTAFPLTDISIRGVRSNGLSVKTCGPCDGLYIANAFGAVDLSSCPTRVFVDDSQDEPIASPLFPEEKNLPLEILSANDPAFWGETDAQTLQNAVNAAAAQGAMLLIPRWNIRTKTTVWNIDKSVVLPSNTTVALLHSHLRQADFCYDNLFSAENAKNITILGVGDSIIDGGMHNQLKTRNASQYGIDIRSNATLYFRNTENLVIDAIQMKNARWYSICFEFCRNGKISNIDFKNPPLLPDQGGIRLHSGCHDFLVENLTGLVGEDLIDLEALSGDGVCGSLGHDIHNIRIRNLSVNTSRRVAVRLLCHDDRRIHNVLIESVLDPSLPEDKMLPWATIAVGSLQMSTDKLCNCEDLSNIMIRDIHSRAIAALELSGNSSEITLTNAHGFGSSNMLIRIPRWANCQKFLCRALFFRCIQGSPYMRGTATSTIKDPKKYIGKIAKLSAFRAQDALLEHIFAENVGEGFSLSGGGKVIVRDCNIGTIGRKKATCSSDSVLEINGEIQPTAG